MFRCAKMFGVLTALQNPFALPVLAIEKHPELVPSTPCKTFGKRDKGFENSFELIGGN